jgi:hypothetical protein
LIHLVIDYRGIDGGTLPARAPVATAAAAVPCSPWFKTTSTLAKMTAPTLFFLKKIIQIVFFLIG